MTKPLYTLESESATELKNLGYNASVHDLVVQAAHTELNRFLQNEREAVSMWGWNSDALHDVDRYRIAQLLRSFVYQEQSIVAALRRLDETYRAYIDASPENRERAEAFIASLNLAAARRAVDHAIKEFAGLLQPTEDERNRVAEAVVASWQKAGPGADAHVSGREKQIWWGLKLVTDELASLVPLRWKLPKPPAGLDPADWMRRAKISVMDRALENEVGVFTREIPADYRRVYTVRSIVDFHDPEIAHPVESGVLARAGLAASLWRLMDHGYPPERIPDGLLYDLVDTVLAVQAEYQLQCVFVDREMSKIVDTRGKEEQWLYEKTAEWAAERAAAKQREIERWGLWGDIIGMISAVAGVLTFIPGVSLIAGPIALVTAAASLGLHAKAVSLKEKVDAADGITLATDALSALPVVGAVSKGAKGAWAAARMNKVANVIVSNSGRAFIGAIASKSASDANRVFDYLGKKGAQAVTGTATQSKIPGKVLQGAVALITQVPTAVDWATNHVDQSAKDTAAGTALTANIGQTVSEWDTVGMFTKKVGTISLNRFSMFFKGVKV
ncbi:hypothetical protein ACWCZ5_03550 [Streptomyces sp. NPDC001667]